MTTDAPIGLPMTLRRKPLQTGKFIGVLLALVLGIAGFFRVIDATVLVDDPLLADGQFLALVLLPLVGLALVILVFVETMVAAARAVLSEDGVVLRVRGRPGYVLLRGAEAAFAVLGVLVMASVLPVLVADSTPAPAGVGGMLLLAAVAVGILVASLARTTVELFVYRSAT